MIIFLTVINVILAIVIITMVLLQQGKGSDLGSMSIDDFSEVLINKIESKEV